MTIRKEKLLLFTVILTGIIIRILKFDDVNLVTDTVVYSRLGKNLIEFGRYAFGENYNMGVFFPPGYPILIGLFNLLFHDLFFTAKFVSLILGMASIILAYLIGKELYNKEAGLFAAVLFAFYPILIIVSVQGYSDAPFFAFLLLTLYFYLKTHREDNYVQSAVLGLITGITYLIRPEAMFVLILPFLQIFGIFGERIGFSRRRLVHFVITFALFATVISPYMIFIKNYTGKFTLSGKSNISILLGKLSGDRNYHQIVNAPDNVYDTVAFALNESKTELMGWSRHINLSLKDYILGDMRGFIKRYQKNMTQEIQVLIKLLVPFILPFFFSFFYRDLLKDEKKIFFLILPLIFLAIYPMFVVIEKQSMLIVLFLLIFSSGGFPLSRETLNKLGEYYGIQDSRLFRLFGRYIKHLMIIMLIAGSLLYLKFSTFEHHDKAHAKPEEHKRAGYYLKAKLNPDYEELNIMSKFPYVSFYSNSRFTMIPYASVDDVVLFAKKYNVDFIVVDERALGGWKFYNELLHMDKYSDEVELFYEDTSEKTIKLFKIKDG